MLPRSCMGVWNDNQAYASIGVCVSTDNPRVKFRQYVRPDSRDRYYRGHCYRSVRWGGPWSERRLKGHSDEFGEIRDNKRSRKVQLPECPTWKVQSDHQQSWISCGANRQSNCGCG